MNSIGNEWLSHLVSSEPADRPQAQSALHDLYVASGFPAPSYFFWLDSPFRATLAMILLAAVHDSFMRQWVAALDRTSARAQIAR